MATRFLSDLFILILLNLIIKPFWVFGIDRTVQNTIGTEVYGTYFAIFNLSLLFNIVLEMGVNNFNNRAVAQNHDNIKSYFPNLLSLKALLSIFYALILIVVAFVLGYAGQQIYWLVLLIINQIIVSYLLFVRSNISGLQQFRIDSYLSIIDKLAMIIICATLLWLVPFKNSFDISWFVYAQIAGNLIALSIAFIAVKKLAGKIKWQANFNVVKGLLKKAMPYALLGFLMTVYFRIDGVMLERLLVDNGDTQNGIYAAGFRLLDTVIMIAFLFATILMPLFAKLLAEKQEIEKLLNFSGRLLVCIAIIAALSIMPFAQQIMDVLYTESTIQYGNILKILMFTFIPVSIVYVYGTLLAANGNMRLLNSVAFLAVILNVVLNFVLISKWQAMGAAIATLITQLLVAFVYIIMAHQTINVNINFKEVGAMSLFFAISYVAAIIASNIDHNWLLYFCVLVAFMLVLAFLFNILNVNEFKKWAGFKQST